MFINVLCIVRCVIRAAGLHEGKISTCDLSERDSRVEERLVIIFQTWPKVEEMPSWQYFCAIRCPSRDANEAECLGGIEYGWEDS